MSEFNLSERIKLAKNQEPNETWYHEAIIIEDVKEFIKRLKEEIESDLDAAQCEGGYSDPIKIIDKLAGDKLC